MTAMPHYFFQLRFDERILPVEEGIELPSRSAARDEALAVIEELSKPEEAGKSRRWASWFLEVTDDEGQFLRLPMGHPALEIAGPCPAIGMERQTKAQPAGSGNEGEPPSS
jgi:uncharacterized protein DUF6894